MSDNHIRKLIREAIESGSRGKQAQVELARHFIKKAVPEALTPEEVEEITDEDMRLEADARKARDKFAKEAGAFFWNYTTKEAGDLLDQIDGRLSLSKQKREFVKLLKQDPLVMDWWEKYMDSSDHYLYFIRDYHLGDVKVTEKRESVVKKAKRVFEKKWIQDHHEKVIDKVIPKEMKKFLPENLVLEVDEDGVIEKTTDRL